MNFKKLTDMVLMLVSQPAKAWRQISHNESRSPMFNEYLYPLIMICSLSTLLGTLFTHEWGTESFYFAVVKMGVQFATLFLAYHILAFSVAKIISYR